MKMHFAGPRGGELPIGLQAMGQLVGQSFLRQLGINRLRGNILVRLHKALTVDSGSSEGLCECVDARNFVVDVAMWGNWMSTLAHEFVHVKQFARGELSENMTRWKSNRYAGDIEYWDQPWEKEARRLQHKLVWRFELENQ